MKIVYLTPGAGGMYCGSCMNDNMLAAALMRMGHDVCLVPMYTPTVTDEPNQSIGTLFFGGINVYLQQKVPLFRALPRFADRILDWPAMVKRLAGGAVSIDARALGDLTLSMVRGEKGNQRKEVRRLVDWLAHHQNPDVVNLSNLLIAGCAPAIRRQLKVPIVVTLQGDDLFLDDLPETHRDRVIAELRGLARGVDRFVVHSRYYGDLMSEMLQIPSEKIDTVALGVSLDGIPEAEARGSDNQRPPTIGYLARICHAKGFHLLVDAFLQLKRELGLDAVRLHAAGWLGETDRDYYEQQAARIRDAGFDSDFEFFGVLDRGQKFDFLRGVDVFSVPTVYREPKGRYVLEALASGVPVVQPEHGAFPEILARTGGGRLVPPEDAFGLASALNDLLKNDDVRRQLGREGRRAVHSLCSAEQAAEQTLQVYQKAIDTR